MGVSVEDRLRVTAPAEGGVDDPAFGRRGEERHDFVGHHRSVGERALGAGVHGGRRRRTAPTPGPLIGSPSDHGRPPGCLPD